MAGIKTQTIMNMQHFHDFYFLQAMEAAAKNKIAANPEMEFQKPVEKFLDDLDRVTEKLVPNMALRTFMYLYAACLGEARHAKDTVARERFVAVKGRVAREDWFAKAAMYRPTKANLNALLQVFAQEWRAGYGGEAWMNIAEALTEYEKTPPAAWIDHVIDLEHNNGTAFSKPDGEATIFFSVYYPERFSCFLDYKFAKDILKKSPNFADYLSISPRIHALLTKYSIIFKEPEVKHVKPELENLSDYSVEWGDEELRLADKWSDWASVGDNNKPNVNALMEDTGFFSFFAGYYTKEEYLRKVAKLQVRMFASLNPKIATPYFKSKLAKAVAKFAARNLPKCKMSKAKTTYKIIPCKFVYYDYGKGKLTIDMPYQDGYGEKTEEGFTVKVDIYVEKSEMNKEYDGYIERHYGDTVLFMKNSYHYVSSSVLEALID